jgi:hypothetical protein
MLLYCPLLVEMYHYSISEKCLFVLDNKANLNLRHMAVGTADHYNCAAFLVHTVTGKLSSYKHMPVFIQLEKTFRMIVNPNLTLPSI